MGINVLSLFDGMSCGQIALERAGIKVNQYYASEIDKHAIKVTMANYPNTIQLGSVSDICVVKPYLHTAIYDLTTKEELHKCDKIDLLIGGSPCQGFSFAGKGLNFEDPRSKLFFEYVRILNEIRKTNPDVKFLLENVRMKKEHQDIISKYLGVEPVFIDSKLLSASTRKRFYWANFEIAQPENKNIVLKDVIEYGYVDRDKAYCIDANYSKGGDLRQYLQKSRRQLVFLTEDEIERAYIKYKGKTWKSGNRMGTMQFPDNVNKPSKCISSTVIKGSRETVHIEDKSGIRILTPLEAERCLTIPDNYSQSVANTNRYHMIGNGWTIDVIAHIFKGLNL